MTELDKVLLALFVIATPLFIAFEVYRYRHRHKR
jgi:hypothetical protein